VLLLLWDASALAKRYGLEVGSEAVDALFAEVPADQMVTTFLGYAETYSTLLRKRNRGAISAATFRSAASFLQREILDSTEFRLLSIDDMAVLNGIEHMERYNLNASDAAILVACLRYAEAEAAAGSTCVLVVADQRLLRAARAEGLPALDPEPHAAADIPSVLAMLQSFP
jgi:predicted nucleic acid-binding protein